MRDTSELAKECSPENKEGYIFIIKIKMERGEDHLLPRSWADVKIHIISSSFDPAWSKWDCHGTI